MKNSYDNVAWFYDSLTRLVYGKALVRAQQYLLAAIPAGATVLIVGGGTGWILEELAALHPSGLKVAYVEIAAKMMALAKKKNAGDNEVLFINTDIQTADLGGMYDAVLTPFLFDNFSEPTLQNAFRNIHAHLKEGGLWLFADFQVVDSKKIWQKMTLKMMYLFFGLICRIEATSMPDTGKYFSAHHYRLEAEKAFFHKFIISKIFSKQQVK